MAAGVASVEAVVCPFPVFIYLYIFVSVLLDLSANLIVLILTLIRKSSLHLIGFGISN